MTILFTPLVNTIIDCVLFGGGAVIALLIGALPILLIQGANPYPSENFERDD